MMLQEIAKLREQVEVRIDPAHRGPVPLNRFFEELGLAHVALPQLRLGKVREHLLSDGIPVQELGDPNEPLAGFLFVAGRTGRIFVNADDILPRRRFTAAHELGHAVLHRERMESFLIDTSISETGDSKQPMEREADRFAAELLMPEEVIRYRADQMVNQFGVCPRLVLAYRLASEFLVSREAIRYRLKALEVGDD